MGPRSDVEVARQAIGLLDLTDLADDTTNEAATALCATARRAGVAAVCVWPRFVATCATALADDPVGVATVVNFPAGDEPLSAVTNQTRQALADGADEIDVVLPYRAWLDGDTVGAGAMLDAVRDLVAEGSGVLKVIIETGELPHRAAIDAAAHFAIAHGADFVKTSSGKTPVSATPEAAETILEAIAVSGAPVGIKVAGGVRTFPDATAYITQAAVVMGDDWITPEHFRFGASSLLQALEAAAE